MTQGYCTTALFALAGIIGVWGSALAADPTQSDFDTCNREAQAGSPSASVRDSISTGSGTKSTPGAPASGSMSSPSGSTGSSSPGATGSSSPGSTGAGSGAPKSSGGDPSLRGIAAAGMSDPAYQQAYRDCLTRRGF